jgi:16S rRNA (cytidine1402-2'-O)-methyltransferase
LNNTDNNQITSEPGQKLQPIPPPKLPIALYVVATPIGNLGDITTRALDTLKNVHVVAAEDTRNTQQLLSHFGIRVHTIAVHEHNERNAADGIVKLLREGNTVALVTDAGTPAVSDPGARVVTAVHEAGFAVVPVAGASAVVAAISASGEGEDGFLFHGFLPAKSGERKALLSSLRALPYALVFYESPHRIEDCIADMAEVFEPSRTIVFCREITKKFETIHRTIIAKATQWLEEDDNNRRGEFVIIVGPSLLPVEEDNDEAIRDVVGALLTELPLKQAVGLAVKITGEKKNAIYEMALKIQKGE